MNKKCAKCTKTVYPTEELKCLDKVWHKACFKCTSCNMTLNMKNYKGYDKLPYCNAHYPTTKFTAVADTPESRRIAENTKIQSNVQYHSDFERTKANYTVVPDNPELLRHLSNTKNASLNEYHSDFNKMKNKYTSVAVPADMVQHLQNTKNVSLNEYHRSFEESKGKCLSVARSLEMEQHLRNTKNASLVSYHADFEKQKGKKTSVVSDPETERIRYNTQIQSAIAYQGVRQRKDEMEQKRPAENLEAGRAHHHHAAVRTSGYAPTQDEVNSPYSGKQTSNVVYDSKAGQDLSQPPAFDEDIQNGMGRRQPGSIADYDPMNDRFGSITGSYPNPPPQQQAYHEPPPQQPPPQKYVPPPQQQPPLPQRPMDPYANKGMVCKAMYDYVAGDDDEVGFLDGDIIVQCEPVDQGWMTGIVERTGQHGMLPSNYVERIN
ncbi:LIM and SH3 domain protein F42H10.3-like isoform X3 [Gigantopelta aegis]|uniref:LIM and SH3 domain protein F42H10.3-like isoform X3 n=1 Tax=Gigantopelta aegis TaxID=1735272 RepID=UPI001B88C960|nr:LIM and SH3 domain protein F42H10.3-like isoform X3 [Gigantopelta aegis]